MHPVLAQALQRNVRSDEGLPRVLDEQVAQAQARQARRIAQYGQGRCWRREM
ncbi:hypothetical protein STIAU_1323, partial [Stigmatella aurantiaca DW4/3-1]